MRSLSASELLEVWERGVGQPSVERALTLLSACEAEPNESLPSLSIGQRDERLMAVHECLFGDTLNAFAECPVCAERLEYSVSTRDLRTTRKEITDFDLRTGGLSLRLRLPNSLDLKALNGSKDVESARRMLAERCVLEATENGNAVPARELPESIVEKIAMRLGEADPQSETFIDLTCAACRHQWKMMLDIERFLWAKINALAKRLLREVHVLARAYGWSEADILAQSAVRRQFYLEMLGA